MARGRKRARPKADDAAAGNAAPGGDPDWSDLPIDAVYSIAEQIPSSRDLVAFSAVSRSYLAAARAASTSAPDRRPPLLFRQHKHLGRPSWRILDPAATAGDPSAAAAASSRKRSNARITSSMSETVKDDNSLVGVSRGRLIIFHFRHRTISVADPISGDKLLSPPIPSEHGGNDAAAILSDCSTLLVVLSHRQATVLQWRLAGDDQHWAVLLADARIPERISRLIQMADGRIFAAGDRFLYTVELGPRPAFTLLAALPPKVKNARGFSAPRRELLVACGEMLVYLRFRSTSPADTLAAFRLETPPSAPAAWREMDSFGDWAVFVSLRHAAPTYACRSPERWGGKSNCVYLANPPPPRGSTLTVTVEDDGQCWLSLSLGASLQLSGSTLQPPDRHLCWSRPLPMWFAPSGVH